MEKPEIEFPGAEPPADLVITDVTEGDGAEATSGSTVSVHYVGVAHSTGEEFDASYNRGTPLQFRLGTGQVIQGWDQGVEGMKVGGRRQLVIPPHLGYGDRGAGGVIKPGETLIFVVDLLERELSGFLGRRPGWDDRRVTESPLTTDVRISDESIKLGQFLKLADLVESGSAAKPLLAGGMVRVNDVVETRRGRQLVDGDVVAVAHRSVRS